jgi:hypothetical protein
MSLAIGIMISPVAGTGGGASYDADASALFARFTTPPTDARKALINTMILSLKTASVWSKLDALYVLAAADSQAARQNWIQNLYNATAVSSPTFTADRGYQGDGASSYLTTGFTPSSAVSPKYVQNSAHLSVWSRTDVESSGVIMGARTGAFSNQALIQPRVTGSVLVGRINQNGNGANLTNGNSSGHIISNRTDSANRKGFRNGVSLGSLAEATNAVPTAAIFVGAYSDNGTPGGFGTWQIAASSIGASLSDAEALAFYNALQTYMTAVGA